MRDLGLALRLVAGGGRRGWARLVLLAAGLAVALVGVLLVAQVPGALAAREQARADREPVPAVGREVSSFTFSAAPTSWDGRVVTRVFLDAADTAGTAPVPPGLDRLPGSGEVVLSPAAADLAADDPGFAALVPGERVGAIAPDGLAGPDELVAYVGLDADDLVLAQPGLDWGVPARTAPEAAQLRNIGVELLVLVLPAVALFLLACSRLAASARRRRLAALSLVGASPRTVQRVGTYEAALTAVPAVLAAYVVHAVVRGPVAESGVLGFAWYADRVGPDPWLWLGTVAVVVVGSRLAGASAARRATRAALRERREQPERRPRWWWLVPTGAGLGLLLPWLPWPGAPPAPGGRAVEVMVVTGVLLSSVGVLLTSQWLVRAVAARLDRLDLPLAVGLGVRRVLVETGGAVRLMTGLGLLLIVGTVGAGAAQAAEQTASSQTRPVAVHVYANEVSPASRGAVGDLPARLSWAVVSSKLADGPTPEPDGSTQWAVDHLGVRMLVADCDDLDAVLGARLAGCAADRLYRVVGPDSELPLDAGQPVVFERDGRPVALEAPEAVIELGGRGGGASNVAARETSLVFTGSSPPGGWIDDTVFEFRIGAGLDELDDFTSALATVAPLATANGSIDLSAITAYRAHRGAIVLGVSISFVLGALAMLVALVDRSLERRSVVVALVAVGTRRATIRGATLVFGVLPFVVVVVASLLTGCVAANALVSADTGAAWSWDPLATSWPLIAVGLVLVALAGAFVSGLDPEVEDLRRE